MPEPIKTSIITRMSDGSTVLTDLVKTPNGVCWETFVKGGELDGLTDRTNSGDADFLYGIAIHDHIVRDVMYGNPTEGG